MARSGVDRVAATALEELRELAGTPITIYVFENEIVVTFGAWGKFKGNGSTLDEALEAAVRGAHTAGRDALNAV